MMAPRKKVTGGATSKGKAKATAGGTTSKRIKIQPNADGAAPPLHRSRLSALCLYNSKKTSCFSAQRDKEADQGKTKEVRSRAGVDNSRPRQHPSLTRRAKAT